jgi:hypothetical protein
MPGVAVFGIDLGETSGSVARMPAGGHVVLRRRVARDRIADVLAGALAPHHAAATCADRGQKSDRTIIPDQRH